MANFRKSPQIGTYGFRSGEHEDDEDEEHSGLTTAEIVANQSQDYVDEKELEYLQTIHHLAGKTFFRECIFLSTYGLICRYHV